MRKLFENLIRGSLRVRAQTYQVTIDAAVAPWVLPAGLHCGDDSLKTLLMKLWFSQPNDSVLTYSGSVDVCNISGIYSANSALQVAVEAIVAAGAAPAGL